LRGHDYAKYDHVSYEEALSVAGFWGVVNPTESKLLMHLSELYCVCEPRVYCTVLLWQAAANAFVMEKFILLILWFSYPQVCESHISVGNKYSAILMHSAHALTFIIGHCIMFNCL